MDGNRYQRIQEVARMSDAEIADVDIDELDELAFGYVQGVQELPLVDLHVKYADDYENAVQDVQEDPDGWVDVLDEPIDVVLERGILFVDDGHHRYVTAQTLDHQTILADVQILDNPVITIRKLAQAPYAQVIEYRGAVYRLAQEPAEEGTDAPNPLAPDERTLGPEETKELAKDVDAAVGAVRKAADKLFQKYQITHQDAGSVREGDGIDLLFDISTAGTPNAELVLDYKLDWIDKKTIKVLRERAPSPGVLQEVYMDYCNAEFVASTKEGFDGLLKAISLLQNVNSVSGQGAYERLPHTDADMQDQIEWLLSQILAIMEDRPDVDIDFTDKGAVLQQFEVDRSEKRLDPQQFSRAKEVLDSFTAEGWAKAVDEMLEKIQRRDQFKPSRAAIEKMILELTAHEDYRGGFDLIHDPKTNYIAAELKSPYEFRIILDWDPGVTVKFKEAHLVFCKRTYVAPDETKCKELLTAMVDLVAAFNEAPNEKVSPDRAKQKAPTDEDLVKQLVQQILRDPATWIGTEVERGAPEDLANDPEAQRRYQAFQRVVQQDPAALIDMATRNPDATRKFFQEFHPNAVNWLRKANPELHKQVRDLLFAQEEVVRPEMPGLGL